MCYIQAHFCRLFEKESKTERMKERENMRRLVVYTLSLVKYVEHAVLTTNII